MADRTAPRLAERSEVPTVVELAVLMYSAIGVEVSAAWRVAVIGQIEERQGEDLAAWVSSDETGIVSSGVGLLENRLTTPRSGPKYGHIQWLATEPRARRQGHGRAVMTSIIGWLEERGADTIELLATDDGMPLYTSLGFGAPAHPYLSRRAEDPRTTAPL